MTSSYTPQSPFQETMLRGLVILVTLQERKSTMQNEINTVKQRLKNKTKTSP